MIRYVPKVLVPGRRMVHAKEEMVTIEIIYNGSLLYYHDSTLGIHPDAVRNCTQSRHRTAVSQMTRVMTDDTASVPIIIIGTA